MRSIRLAVLSLLFALPAFAQVERGGTLPPLFPANNWWNVDVSNAPLAPQATQDAIINFIGPTDGLRPDFGGDDGSAAGIYGMVYMSVPGTQPLVPVVFDYADESDYGAPGRPVGYPIPEEAKSGTKWVEGGYPCDGPVESGDKHMLIVDRDNGFLFETWDTRYNDALQRWEAGSGAVFDLARVTRRPKDWTSADAAGLEILPGLVRYDEVFGADPIRHAFRFTVRATSDYYVYPANHRAGTNTSAPPLGTRLRLKASKDISGYPEHLQKIFQAMKTYGLILADNGSDMYVQGAYDTRWDNGVLNPAFATLKVSDFEVVELGHFPDYADVPPSHPFYSFIERLGKAAVTGGCGGGNYCPSNAITRAQMAVFLLAAKNSSNWVPPAATGSVFADVPASNPFAAWIEALYATGATAGCGNGNYCPNAAVTRGQMAVFLLRVLRGSSYTPPAVGETPMFSDVPATSGFAPWIEELARSGITAGCGGGKYCPNDVNTRGQMAVFIATTFNLAE